MRFPDRVIHRHGSPNCTEGVEPLPDVIPLQNRPIHTSRREEHARLERERLSCCNLTLTKTQQPPKPPVSSPTNAEASDQELLKTIVSNWDAIENGAHRVRGFSMGNNACRIAHPKASRNMLTLSNLAIGLYCRLRNGERTNAPSLPSWRRSMKLSAALRHIRG